MASRNTSAALSDHLKEISAVIEGRPTLSGSQDVSASWRRSAAQHKIDPAACDAPRVLTESELADRRERLANLVADAGEEINRLHGLVRAAGYVVLLCDAGGAAIHHQGDERHSSEFRHWGIWLGGMWSEEMEGTNGIGTCIAEQRSITVHGAQHFRTRHIGLSCSASPIFDVDGTFLGALDVSSFDASISEHAHALTGTLAEAAARDIEERRFRKRYHRDWVIAMASPHDPSRAGLLAVDADYRVIGADRAARSGFGIDDHAISKGVAFWSLFERSVRSARWSNVGDFPLRLTTTEDHAVYPALVTAPTGRHGTAMSAAEFAAHTRPRSDLVPALIGGSPPVEAQGGLTMRAIRRIEDYLESNLGEEIELAQLAEIAGLSKFHFARQFRKSTGTTPRRHLMQRRLERARKMLVETDWPLSKIAVMTGFVDQSHFARQFRRITGTTPGRFRRTANGAGI